MLGGYPMEETVLYIQALQRNLLPFDTDPSNRHNTFLRCLLSHQTEAPGNMTFHRMAHRTVLDRYLVERPVLL